MKWATRLLALTVPAGIALAVAGGTSNGAEKRLWLVITRPMFAKAIRPLADRRRTDGFQVAVSTDPPPKAIGSSKRRPAFILLVGDDQSGKRGEPWYVPAKRRKLYRWRATQRTDFASDAAWGDLDGDLVPEVPVGRLPVRTPQQLERVVRKILAFERRRLRPDDLRLLIWAGSPGYNPVINSMATGLLVNSVQAHAPAWTRLWAISADPRHPLCGWPGDQGRLFTKQLKRGGLAAVMMGHGTARSFYSMDFQGGSIVYKASDAEEALGVGNPGPLLVLFTCDSGNFAGRGDCLAESFLSLPAGPIAVIGATTESHPLPNALSGTCLVGALGGNDRRLGSLWLGAQQQAVKRRDFLLERMLRDVEGKLEENINIAKLRRDHMPMYALLGDPATRLPLPDRLNVKIQRRGDGWYWNVDKPHDAARLHVGFRRLGQTMPPVKGALQPQTARAQFGQANATFSFTELDELDARDSWQGTISEKGTLRLVATGPARIYVAVIRLEQPTTRPNQAGGQ